MASTHVLPALVTLGSDQNLNVKYASIDAFGAVAQHFKNEMVLTHDPLLLFIHMQVFSLHCANQTSCLQIVDKIRVQMDAFLEDGSHEATVSVVRALVVAVPHTIDRLREYILDDLHMIFFLQQFMFSLGKKEKENFFFSSYSKICPAK